MILPELFSNRMKIILDEEFHDFQHSFDIDVATSIRINPLKYSDYPNLERVGFCDTGYFIPQRPVFTIDPFMHSGVYYVQESSSMFLEQIIKQCHLKDRIKVLDLCASPGGKSTHLASMLDPGSLLVSNDVIRTRSQILSENLKKWGNANVVVTNNDPHDFQRLPQYFDMVIIDAPCSGEGLFKRDPNAVQEWSPDNARLCAQRQQRILADVWPTLKNGGILVYSTCTFNPAENEDNINWLNQFADIEPVSLTLSEKWGITVTQAGMIPCYRFYPHKVKGEGLFICAVRKMGENVQTNPKKQKENPLNATKTEKEMVKGYLTGNDLEIIRFEDSLLAFPANQFAELLNIKSNLRIVHAGMKIGDIKQKDLVPAHELAMSTQLNRGLFPVHDLCLKDAIQYLKRDEISMSPIHKGWNLITYRNIPLGWIKNLGNRYNNYFPAEWRIRMSVSEYNDERLKSEMLLFPL